MSPSSTPPVGERIRAERLRQGISLRALARAVGVSASLVSQVETGKSQPSVSTLYAITTALGISIEDVFDARVPAERRRPAAASSSPAEPPGAPPPPAAVPSTRRDLPTTDHTTVHSGGSSGGSSGSSSGSSDGGSSGASSPTGGGARSGRVGPLVRREGREVLELDSGVTWQRLGRVPGSGVDFLLITYPPGGSSSGTGALMRHRGTEYGYLLEGELILTLGFEEHHLRPGDALSFESATPHRFHNASDRPAVGVWFVSDTDG